MSWKAEFVSALLIPVASASRWRVQLAIRFSSVAYVASPGESLASARVETFSTATLNEPNVALSCLYTEASRCHVSRCALSAWGTAQS